jgi:hypothetical protein
MGSSAKMEKEKEHCCCHIVDFALVYVPSRIGSATTTDNPLSVSIH